MTHIDMKKNTVIQKFPTKIYKMKLWYKDRVCTFNSSVMKRYQLD